MSLAQRLAEHVRAAFSAIYIQTHEPVEALREIQVLCHQEQWTLAAWDVDQGLASGPSSAADAAAAIPATTTDPLATVKSLSALAKPNGTALLALTHFHHFLGSPEVIQAVANQAAAGKQNRTFLLILSPVVTLPAELQKLFIVLEHELPGRENLLEIARGVATEPGEMPEADGEVAALLDASAGLTRAQAENAYSLSLVRHRRLVPQVMWELKAASLKASGLLSLHRGGERYADLGGLEALKQFCSKAMAARPAASKARPRGILLLGVPGTGKSAFARALGNETGRPTLTLDVGALMAGLVGATEQNTRTALAIADAMSPCILFCDEIEKAMSGATAASSGDSGVSSRMLGSLLSWLNDHTSDVFFIATANDISRLPPEFTRSERFDGVWFLDLPGPQERALIWRMYLRQFELPEQKMPIDQGWTGAEIRSCCRLAALLGESLVEAARHVVPVSMTAVEQVQKLRGWASARCLDASRGGLYQPDAPALPARKVNRPSSN